MTPTVIIVSAQPDLLALCVAGLRRYAPEVPRYVVSMSPEVTDWVRSRERFILGASPTHTAADHAGGIEYARRAFASVLGDPVVFLGNPVVLLDDDTVILSRDWLPWLQGAFADPALGVLGGVRHRGLIEQAYVDGWLLVHAHHMAIRADLFRTTATFHQQLDPGLGFVRWDTGAMACLDAKERGYRVETIPFRRTGTEQVFRGLGVSEYYDPACGPEMLWAHLGRGTSFAPQGPVREALRRVAAVVSLRARKIRRRQAARAEFLRRGWAVVTA